MNLFEPVHLMIIGLVILVLFGPKKIPELMRSLGSGVGELKKGLDEGKRQLTAAMETASAPDAHTPTITAVAAAVPATDATHAYTPHDANTTATLSHGEATHTIDASVPSQNPMHGTSATDSATHS